MKPNSKTKQSIKVQTVRIVESSSEQTALCKHGSELTLSIAAHALFILSILLNLLTNAILGFVKPFLHLKALEIDTFGGRFETIYPSNNRHYEHKSKAKNVSKPSVYKQCSTCCKL